MNLSENPQRPNAPKVTAPRPTRGEMRAVGYNPWNLRNLSTKQEIREAVGVQRIAQQKQYEKQVQDLKELDKKRAELYHQIQDQHPTSIDQVTPQYEAYYSLLNNRPHKPFDINEQLAIEMTQYGEERWKNKEHPSNQSPTRETIDVLKSSEAIQKLVDQSVQEGGVYFALHLPTGLYHTFYSEQLPTTKPYIGHYTFDCTGKTDQLRDRAISMEKDNDIRGSDVAITVAEDPYVEVKSRLRKDGSKEIYHEPVDTLRMISFVRRNPQFVDDGYRGGMELIKIALPREISGQIMTEIRENPLAAAAFLEMYREEIGFPLYEVGDVDDMNQRRQDAIPVLPFSEVRVRDFEDSPFLEKNNPLTEDKETPYAHNMSAGPRPEAGPSPIQVPQRVEKQAPRKFVDTSIGFGAIMRALNLKRQGINRSERESGIHIKETLEEFSLTKSKYEDPKTANKVDARRDLVMVAKELVDVQIAPSLNLSPDQQAYVDAIAVAAATKLVSEDIFPKVDDDMYLNGLGSNLQRAEIYRQEQPHLFVRQTVDGLAVTVATGEISFTPNGGIQFNGHRQIEDRSSKEKPLRQRESEGKTQVAEYTIKHNADSNADILTYSGGNGQEIPLILHPDSVDFTLTMQRQVDSIERQQTNRNTFYHYEGVVRRVGDEVKARFISARPNLDLLTAQLLFTTYIASGGEVQYMGKDGDTVTELSVTLFDDPNGVNTIFPNDVDGIRFAGITTRAQTFAPEATVLYKAQEHSAAADQRATLKELLQGDEFVSIESIDKTITDSAVALSTLNSSMDLAVARENIAGIIRKIQSELSQLKTPDRKERAFSLALNRIKGLTNPNNENEKAAQWRIAELVAARIDSSFTPTVNELNDRALTLRIGDRKGVTVDNVVADATYLLSRTGTNRLRDVILKEVRENAGSQNVNPSRQKVIREALVKGDLTRNDLSSEELAEVDAGEAAPTTPAEALTRLSAQTRGTNETVEQYGARLLGLARTYGLDRLSQAAVDQVFADQRLDAASLRVEARETLQQLEASGKVTPEVVRKLQESGTYSRKEIGAFNEVFGAVLSMRPLEKDTDEVFRKRVVAALEHFGVTEDNRGAIADVVLQLQGFDKEAQDREAAEAFLQVNQVANPEELRPDQLITYLELTHATPEKVISAVTRFDADHPDESIRALREMATANPQLTPMVDGLVSSIFIAELTGPDVVINSVADSPEQKKLRLTLRAAQLSSLSSHPQEMGARFAKLIEAIARPASQSKEEFDRAVADAADKEVTKRMEDAKAFTNLVRPLPSSNGSTGV